MKPHLLFTLLSWVNGHFRRPLTSSTLASSHAMVLSDFFRHYPDALPNMTVQGTCVYYDGHLIHTAATTCDAIAFRDRHIDCYS
jgi:hypothetical protein